MLIERLFDARVTGLSTLDTSLYVMRHTGGVSVKSWMTPITAAVAIVVAAIPMYLSSQLSFWDTWLSLWTITFVVGFALIALEGAFFMQSPEIRRISQFVMAFSATGVMAAIAAILVSSNSLEFTLADKCRVLLAERSGKDWIMRFIGVAGLYSFVYVAIGSATWPFVREYYENPNHGLPLRVPRARVIIPLQMVRGLLTTMALVPLIAAIPANDAVWWFRLSLLLAAIMAIGPLVMQTRWPARLRLAHAIEISVFAVVYSFTVWLLIARSVTSA